MLKLFFKLLLKRCYADIVFYCVLVNVFYTGGQRQRIAIARAIIKASFYMLQN